MVGILKKKSKINLKRFKYYLLKTDEFQKKKLVLFLDEVQKNSPIDFPVLRPPKKFRLNLTLLWKILKAHCVLLHGKRMRCINRKTLSFQNFKVFAIFATIITSVLGCWVWMEVGGGKLVNRKITFAVNNVHVHFDVNNSERENKKGKFIAPWRAVRGRLGVVVKDAEGGVH